MPSSSECGLHAECFNCHFLCDPCLASLPVDFSSPFVFFLLRLFGNCVSPVIIIMVVCLYMYCSVFLNILTQAWIISGCRLWISGIHDCMLLASWFHFYRIILLLRFYRIRLWIEFVLLAENCCINFAAVVSGRQRYSLLGGLSSTEPHHLHDLAVSEMVPYLLHAEFRPTVCGWWWRSTV